MLEVLARAEKGPGRKRPKTAGGDMACMLPADGGSLEVGPRSLLDRT